MAPDHQPGRQRRQQLRIIHLDGRLERQLRPHEQRRNGILFGAGAAVLLALGASTWGRACVYRNSEALWRDNLAKNPSAWAAHNNLGIALQKAGRVQEAIEHFEQGRCGRACLVQPAVQYLLDCPGRFAQIGQSDHAAAALQGMEAATQRDERCLIVWRGTHLWQMLVDGCQYFVGFFEEDGEQFRIEFLRAGIDQARGFGGRGRRFDGHCCRRRRRGDSD